MRGVTPGVVRGAGGGGCRYARDMANSENIAELYAAAILAAERVETARRDMATAATDRRAAIAALVEAGESKATIARKLNVVPSAITNLLARK